MPLTTITCSPSSASLLSSAAVASCARAKEGAKVNESADVASNTLFAAQDLEITILSPSKHPLDVAFLCMHSWLPSRSTYARPSRASASFPRFNSYNSSTQYNSYNSPAQCVFTSANRSERISEDPVVYVAHRPCPLDISDRMDDSLGDA